MSFLTIDGWPGISVDIWMPLAGIWRVEADVDAPEALTGRVLVEAPGLTLSGTVVASSSYGGRIKVTIEAGAGAMPAPLRARFFRDATYRQIVAETLREAGEELGPMDAAGVVAWSRAAGPPSATLALIAGRLGLTWGATDDGPLTLFSPRWDDLSFDYDVVDEDGTGGTVTLGTTDLSARPGFTIDGRRVRAVHHHVSDTIRSTLICT